MDGSTIFSIILANQPTLVHAVALANHGREYKSKRQSLHLSGVRHPGSSDPLHAMACVCRGHVPGLDHHKPAVVVPVRLLRDGRRCSVANRALAVLAGSRFEPGRASLSRCHAGGIDRHCIAHRRLRHKATCRRARSYSTARQAGRQRIRQIRRGGLAWLGGIPLPLVRGYHKGTCQWWVKPAQLRQPRRGIPARLPSSRSANEARGKLCDDVLWRIA